MKKTVIALATMAFSFTLDAQWNGATNPINTTYSVGIGTTSPDQKLEVETSTAEDGIMIKQTSSGASGLHLKNTYTGGNHWGLFSLNDYNTPAGPHFIIYDYNNSIHRFTIDGNTGNVGIGTIYPSNAKLEVEEDASTNATYIGVSGLVNSSGSGNQQSENIGVKGKGNGGGDNFGGYFEAVGSNATNIGAAAYATSGPLNIGGFFYAGTAANSYGVEGIGEDYAGYFLGNVYRSGTDNFTSDEKLKKNIKPIKDALRDLLTLKPSSYIFKTEDDEYKDMNLPEGLQYGLIAQDLEKVFPNLVGTSKSSVYKDNEGQIHTVPESKTVQYIALIPILIAAIQDQNKIIEDQKTILNQLSEEVEKIKSMVPQQLKTPESTNAEVFYYLNQNAPNPFLTETIITYKIPLDSKKANLNIYDLSGKRINSVNIDAGRQQIKINTDKLTPGIYIYNIIVDDVVYEAKRMVISD